MHYNLLDFGTATTDKSVTEIWTSANSMGDNSNLE